MAKVVYMLSFEDNIVRDNEPTNIIHTHESCFRDQFHSKPPSSALVHQKLSSVICVLFFNMNAMSEATYTITPVVTKIRVSFGMKGNKATYASIGCPMF